MSISGKIISYQLACPPTDGDIDSDRSTVDIIVKSYRLNDNESKLTKEAFLLKQSRSTVEVIYTVVKSKTQANRPHHGQPVLYTFDYSIQSLLAGTYSVFAYENCLEGHGSFVHPDKQAFGWSASEEAGQWAEYTIENDDQNIINADIILRKPHSFFAIGYPVKTDIARFFRINDIPVLQLNGENSISPGYSHGYLLCPHILDWFYFYLLEENFQSIEKYKEFYTLVDPASDFFSYPDEYLLELKQF